MNGKQRLKGNLVYEMDKAYMRFIHRPTVNNYRKLRVIQELILYNAKKKKK